VTTFQGLVRELEGLGCFRPAPLSTLADAALTLLSALALFALAAAAPLWAGIPLFVTASVLYARIGWAMHDAAHGNLCSNRALDEAFTWVFCCILGEFPSGWRHGHNAHHRAPNVRSIDRDKRERWEPDRRYRSRLGAAVDVLVLVRKNGTTLPRLLALLGIRDGAYARRARPDRFPAELVVAVAGTVVFTCFFVFLYGVWGLALYFAYSWVAGVYLNLIFAGNHYDRPAWDEPPALDYAAQQVVTASNYRGGDAMRFLCGGLENQIEHHLFPQMPRRHLRRAAPAVRRYCAEHGIPYVERSFVEAIRSVLDYHVVPVEGAHATE
jgi:fatty acid desaturase